MRKLEIRRLSKDVGEDEGVLTEKTQVDVPEGKKLTFVVFKTDDIDERTLCRLTEALRSKMSDSHPIVLVIGPGDDFEVFEVE